MNRRIGRKARFFLVGITGVSLGTGFFCANWPITDIEDSTLRQLEVQTVQWGEGWGYQIVMNGKVLIYQPTIPAIDTLMAFPDEESARVVGSIVLEKLNNNRDFTITITDIQKSLSYFYR